MKYLTNEQIIKTISFNEYAVEPLNEALLESLLGFIAKIIKFIGNIFTGNSKKVADCKNKAGILSKITSGKKAKCNVTSVKGSPGEFKIPAIDNMLFMAGAYSKALASGNPNVMEQTAIEYGNSKINLDYKEKFESILGNVFHIDHINFYKDEDGDMKMNIGKITTELSKDEALETVNARIPILSTISSYTKVMLDKLTTARDGIDKGLKMTKDKSNLPGDFMDNLNKLLGSLNAAINFVTSHVQGIFNTIAMDINNIFSTFSTSAQQEAGIFHVMELA